MIFVLFPSIVICCSTKEVDQKHQNILEVNNFGQRELVPESSSDETIILNKYLNQQHTVLKPRNNHQQPEIYDERKFFETIIDCMQIHETALRKREHSHEAILFLNSYLNSLLRTCENTAFFGVVTLKEAFEMIYSEFICGQEDDYLNFSSVFIKDDHSWKILSSVITRNELIRLCKILQDFGSVNLLNFLIRNMHKLQELLLSENRLLLSESKVALNFIALESYESFIYGSRFDIEEAEFILSNVFDRIVKLPHHLFYHSYTILYKIALSKLDLFVCVTEMALKLTELNLKRLKMN